MINVIIPSVVVSPSFSYRSAPGLRTFFAPLHLPQRGFFPKYAQNMIFHRKNGGGTDAAIIVPRNLFDEGQRRAGRVLIVMIHSAIYQNKGAYLYRSVYIYGLIL